MQATQDIADQNISITFNQFDVLQNWENAIWASNQNNNLITSAQQIQTTSKNIVASPSYFLEKQEEGGFVAFSSEFDGAIGQGETVEEALADIEAAIRLLKEVIDEDKNTKNKQ